MRVYNLNRIRLFLFGAILSLSLVSLTFMQIHLKNADIEDETHVRNQFIKVPLALSLLWTKSNVLRTDYGDYNRNDITGDNELGQYDDYDQYYEDVGPINEVFKDGDFDTNSSRPQKFESPIKVIINRNPVPPKVITEDNIFWSQWMEKQFPKGLSDYNVQHFLNRVRTGKVVRVEAPTWNKCGRPQNQFVMFEDGTQVCARYRHPHQYLILGEVMSFYLSRLLGMNNVPTVALVGTSDLIWTDVWNDSLSKEWQLNTSVALIEWIDDLQRDRMPTLILDSLISNTSLRSNDLRLKNVSSHQLVELMQWSDLLIFDYLTGNYDRVASMQDAAIKQNNTTILNETIHNLVKSSRTNSIWMIDNESGFLDGYWLMYSQENGNESLIFQNFHNQMLRTICVFRRSTVEHLRQLRTHPNPNKLVIDFVGQYEPTFRRQLSHVKADYLKHLTQHFQQRLSRVFNHIESCRLGTRDGQQINI